MSDFRLKVFLSVARNLNFTKASKEMFISQPAISKHIKELENQYKTTLVNRSGSKIELTESGKLLFAHAEAIIGEYDKLSFAMNALTGSFTGELRLGASTTIAHYLLPEILAMFAKRYPGVKLSMISGNSAYIEDALHQHRIDLGFVEGDKRDHTLRYESFSRDELVLVASTKGVYADVDKVKIEKITSYPLVIREFGSGTLSVMESELLRHNITLSDLNVVMQLGDTEAIKTFIGSSNAIGVVSIISVVRELLNGDLKVIDVENGGFERVFSIVSRHGNLGDIAQKFLDFAYDYNDKLLQIKK